MMCPRGKDTVLLVQFSRGCVKAEMESTGYNIVRKVRGKTSLLTTVEHVGTQRQKAGKTPGKALLEVTFELNHKSWVGVGSEN